jgi:hypothetical protein
LARPMSAADLTRTLQAPALAADPSRSHRAPGDVQSATGRLIFRSWWGD